MIAENGLCADCKLDIPSCKCAFRKQKTTAFVEDVLLPWLEEQLKEERESGGVFGRVVAFKVLEVKHYIESHRNEWSDK